MSIAMVVAAAAIEVVGDDAADIVRDMELLIFKSHSCPFNSS